MVLKYTDEFVKNVSKIRDTKLRAIVAERLLRAEMGNFGDAKSVGGGVSEMRIHYGAGYRLYYTLRGSEIVILLCAGAKSDQAKNIKTAKELAKGV